MKVYGDICTVIIIAAPDASFAGSDGCGTGGCPLKPLGTTSPCSCTDSVTPAEPVSNTGVDTTP